MQIEIYPVGDRVLVKLRKVEEVSQGGIIIAQRTVKLEQMAECLATVARVGPIAWESVRGGPWAKVGDTVMISKYAGIGHQDPDGTEYRLINDVDVLAVVREVTA